MKDEKHCPDLRPQREPRLGQVLPRREEQQQVSSWRVREYYYVYQIYHSKLSSNSYKCAVFFEGLTDSRPLTWIGALPDALKKARNKGEVAEILGKDVTEASFRELTSCDGKTANARCYTIVSRTLCCAGL